MIFIIGMPECGQKLILNAEYIDGRAEYKSKITPDSMLAGDAINEEWRSLSIEHSDAKFVILTKEVELWLDLNQNPDRQRARNFFNQYYAEIGAWFIGSEDRTITLDLDAEDSLYKLYKFMGVPMVQQEPGSLLERGIRYWQARNRWVKAGKPNRTLEEIRDIYVNLCSVCDAFDHDMCGLCGCRLKRDTLSLNKLAWSTEQCPMIPPKWLAKTVKKKSEAPKHRSCCG